MKKSTYEELIHENARLRSLLDDYKPKHTLGSAVDQMRWWQIDNVPVEATEQEIRRLQKIIRQWEERYDILLASFIELGHPTRSMWSKEAPKPVKKPWWHRVRSYLDKRIMV